MSKNKQQQKQMDTQLTVATFTGTELGQELANMSPISIKRKNQRSTNRMKIVENRPFSFYGWVSKAMNHGANRAHSLV